MGLADAAWLGLDRPEHLMVVTVVLRLDAPVTLAALEQLVEQRLVAAYPKFRQRPVRSRVPLLPPSWQDDPGFSVAQHVRELALVDDAALMAWTARLIGTPLEPDRAPWSLTLVQVEGRSAIVARLHHCLADGVALAGVLLSLVDQAPTAETRAVQPGGAGGTSSPADPAAGSGLATTARTAAQTVAKVMVGRRDSGSRLRGPASVGRRAAWTAPLDLALTREAAHRHQVSINDILLAAVAGGLRAWLLDHAAEPSDCRVMVPVDLRRGAAVPHDLGNRFGVVFVTLPVSAATATERLAAVRAATTAAKSSPVAPASYGLLRLVGLMPRWGQGFAANLLGRVATAIVTNVPGPREPLSLAGAPLRSVVFWVPHIGPIGIGVSIFSYAGTVTLGVATNESLDIDPGELVTAIEAELGALGALGATGPASPSP